MADRQLLKQRLRDRDPYVRRDACEVIAELRSGDFIQDLVGALNDENPGVKEAALNALTAIGGHRVAEATAPLLRLDDSGLRNIGIEILEQIGPEASPTISSLLTDEDDDVVKFAVDIISNTANKDAAGMLRGLISHRNPNVRASVSLCLGRLGADGVLSSLLTALDDDEEWVRFSVVEGLGHLGDPGALESLVKVIEKDSLLVKESAVEAVSKISTPNDAPGILVKLSDSVKNGRILAVGAVVELIEKAMMPGSGFRPSDQLKEVYSGFLASSVDENDRKTKEMALRGLALLKAPVTLEKVFSFVSSLKEIDEDTEQFLVGLIVKVAGRPPLPDALIKELEKRDKTFKIIVKALGEMKSEEAVPALEDLVDSVAAHEQREVVAALESIGSPRSMDILYRCLESEDGHTRKISARALAKLAGPEAVERLFQSLKREKYRDVLEEMTDSLGAIPSDAVRDGFLALLGEKSDELREMGARGLGSIGDERAVALLTEAVGDESPKVRKTAYNSLARLGVPEALDTVVSGLKDTEEDVKLAVLKALSGWTGEKLKDALVECLDDRNLWVRYHAVLLLGEFPAPEIEDLLIDIFIKDETPVKAAAAKGLETVGTEKCIEVLERNLDHPDPNVRATVERTLEALTC